MTAAFPLAAHPHMAGMLAAIPMLQDQGMSRMLAVLAEFLVLAVVVEFLVLAALVEFLLLAGWRLPPRATFPSVRLWCLRSGEPPAS